MKIQARPEDRGLRLDLFLSNQLESVTRSHVQLLNRAGAILIEGRQEKAGYRIRGGESIDVDLSVDQPLLLKPEQIPLQIHYEDEDLAVVDKPAGMVVHPGAGTRSGTMVHALLFHFLDLSSEGGESRPGIVHRLDKGTSGLLIVAKNNRAHARLARAFQERRIEKTYLALVHGRPAKPSGTIDLTIGRHPTIRTRMAASAHRGRTALSEYRVVESIGAFSFLEVRIKTGRTHQIRVHLSAIGHPVAGDGVYGEKTAREFAKKYGPINRYFLHAAELRFAHPITGLPLAFRSVLPSELQVVLDRIRSSTVAGHSG